MTENNFETRIGLLVLNLRMNMRAGPTPPPPTLKMRFREKGISHQTPRCATNDDAVPGLLRNLIPSPLNNQQVLRHLMMV